MPSTVILATQRTGSTLLCSEFAAIGGLGRPGEHFLPWLRAAGPDARLSKGEFDRICDEGRDETGAVGLKLMADYLPRLAAAMGAGAPDDPPERRAAALIAAIAARIGPVTLFRIDRRDRFAQALSRHLATATGVYFRTTDGTVTRGEGAVRTSEAELLAALDLRRLEHLLRGIARECALLDRVELALDRAVLGLSYEDLAAERERVLPACCIHAGVPVPEDWPARWMSKVVDPELTERFRRRAIAAWLTARDDGRALPPEVLALLPAPSRPDAMPALGAG